MCIVKNKQLLPCVMIREESKIFNKIFQNTWEFSVYKREDNQLQTLPVWTCV